MPEFVPIYQERDFYVPAFDIKIKGVDLPVEVSKSILEVSYRDSIDQIDSFEITLNNWDGENRDFLYTGAVSGAEDNERSTLFDPGKEIELWMGYLNPPSGEQQQGSTPLRLMLAGIITRLTPGFPASGQPTLKVSGQNVLRKLITEQETYVYPENSGETISDSEIAEKIGQRGNLRIGNLTVPIRINEEAKSREPVHEHVLQDNQYDILFLIQLARRNGYNVFLRYENQNGESEPFLYFGPSTEDPPIFYILEWGKSLIQFQPSLVTTRQVYEVTVRGWDALRREAIVETVNRSQLQNRNLRYQERQQAVEDGFRERKEIIADRPFRNAQQARQYALDRLERLSGDMVTGNGSTVGHPDLRAGTTVDIRGLGATFSGNYFIKSTTHTMGNNGYTAQFEARLEERNQ